MTRTIDPTQVHDLMSELGSKQAVADRLGISEATLRRRAKVDDAVNMALLEGYLQYRERTYPHGRIAGYRQGCRCESCTNIHRVNFLRQKTSRALRQHEATHGRASTYLNWSCRCTPCTEAHSAYLKQLRGGTR